MVRIAVFESRIPRATKNDDLLGFTNGSGFHGPLLVENYGSLVRGETSLEIRKVAWGRRRSQWNLG